MISDVVFIYTLFALSDYKCHTHGGYFGPYFDTMSLFKNKIKIEGLNIIVQNPIQQSGLDYNQQQFKLELKNPSYLQEFHTPWEILRFNPQNEISR